MAFFSKFAMSNSSLQGRRFSKILIGHYSFILFGKYSFLFIHYALFIIAVLNEVLLTSQDLAMKLRVMSPPFRKVVHQTDSAPAAEPKDSFCMSRLLKGAI